LAQSLHLLNSKEVQTKLASDVGRPAAMAVSSQTPTELLEELYLTALSRHPTPEELETAVKYVTERADRKREAYEDLVWAIINSKEFLFNH
jgi:hypothetical protein